MILSVDPGDTNGVALFDDDGQPITRWQCDFDQLLKDLSDTKPIATVIVEDYRLRKGKQAQQTGSRFQAVQTIGALKHYCFLKGAEFILVNVQAKTLGAMYSGTKPPSDHKKSHSIDAYNIGIYWLVEQGIIEPPSLQQLKNDL